MSKYDDLVTKLKEIFQIDKPELDFGVYRILNARVVEINDYLENRLKANVTKSLASSGAANLEGLQKELKDKETQYTADGIDPNSVPKIQEIKQKLAAYSASSSEHENAVFTHLLTFFSRYYDKGDFISQRRYKGDTYAIPYAGEEVVLHWANKDQYYTKSGENFTNFGFKLDDGRSVRFRLVAADTAKDNRKDTDKERRFVLIEPQSRTVIDDEGEEYQEQLEPIAEENGELVIRFEYKAMPKGSKQDDLVAQAAKTILNHPIVKARWLDLTSREPTEKNPQRTLLEKCLANYTARNSADYFIHKDLGTFLRRELDFYIKNEVMNLDDVQHAEKFADIEHNLRMIQALRSIALDLITFLAQLEDFQKKLWLKKKFVVSAHYCITLDRIIKEAPALLDAIAANPKQWAQWEELGMLIGKTDLINQAAKGTVDYLQENPYLMVDSALFDFSFKQALLAAIHDLDDSLDGLLVHGDNFQALNLLQERCREQIKCIYIDPPYNTGQDGFFYKDAFKSSSWISMIGDRISMSRNLLADMGVLFVSINEIERDGLAWQLRNTFGEENRVEELIWTQDTVSNNAPMYSTNHEYIEVFAKNRTAVERNPFLFRETRPGFKEVMEVVNELGSQMASISDIENTIKDLYKTHRAEHLEKSVILGQTKEDAEKNDPWKGIYPYKHVEYRNDSGKYVHENLLKETSAKPWVWREVEPSMPSGKQSETTKDYNSPNYRYYSPLNPVTGFPCKPPKRGWAFPQCPIDNRPSYESYVQDNRIWFKDSNTIPQLKYFLHEVESVVSTSVIRQYADGEPQLEALFGQKELVQNPKPPALIQKLIRQTSFNKEIVIDFFAGSGTTGHSVISVNREDKLNRKYILVEQGEYFDTALKPRIQKVVYSAAWKDGKATAPHTGISHAFKVLKIESYEDALNNLELRRTQQQTDLLESLPQSAQDDYLLSYMLDIESRGSLLSVEQFAKPFDFKLKVTVDSAGAYEERPIDLVETFNYLIGLKVKHIDMQINQGFVLVVGWLPSGELTLVLWRDVDRVDYEALNRLCDKLAINPADSEYEVVYINGDHNIPSVFTSLENEGGITKSLKIRQIEPEFLSRMFDVESV